MTIPKHVQYEIDKQAENYIGMPLKEDSRLAAQYFAFQEGAEIAYSLCLKDAQVLVEALEAHHKGWAELSGDCAGECSRLCEALAKFREDGK